MTANWDRFIETGEGGVEFRVSPEGSPIEFVTNAAMEGTTADGRQRVAGLDPMSIGFRYRVDLPTGELDVTVDPLRIMNEQRDERVLAAFWKRPEVTTWLDADLTESTTTLTLKSTTGLEDGDVVHVGTEAILIGVVATGTTCTGCTRAYWGTIAQVHKKGDGAELSYPEVTNWPVTLQGRRVKIYGYATGDSLGGSGTELFTAVIDQEADEDVGGTTWTVQLASVKRLFETDLGASLKEPVQTRGCYYPASAPFMITAILHDGADPTTARTAASTVTVIWSGFAETNDDFVSSLNADLDAAFASSATKVRARSFGNDGWGLYATTDGTAKWISIFVISPVDQPPQNAMAIVHLTDPATGRHALSVSATSSYETDFVGGPIPRGFIGDPPRRRRSRGGGYADYSDPTGFAAAPPNRIYLSGSVIPSSSTTAAAIEWPGDVHGNTEVQRTYTVEAFSASDRWIEVPYRQVIADPHQYHRGKAPTIKLGFEYAVGNVSDFIDSLVTNSPIFANRGEMPFVTVNDASIAEIATEVDAGARGRTWINRRRFITFGDQKLLEMIEHELRAAGCCSIVDIKTSGKFSARRVQFAAPTDASVKSITATEQVDFPRARRNPRGAITTVVIRTGWKPLEKKHGPVTYVVRDVTAAGRNKVPAAPLEIAPRSEFADGPEAELLAFGAEDARAMATPILGMYGSAYRVASIPLPPSFLKTKLLDNVLVSSRQLPNDITATRGVTEEMGVVVGGRFRPADPTDCSLEVMFHGQEIRGYTPAARVTGVTDLGGNKYELGLSTTLFKGPDGTTTASNYFAKDDKIRLLQVDSESPSTFAGTVTDVNTGTNKVTVQLGAAFSPGATDLYDLGWDGEAAVHAGVNSAAQGRYCFVAGTNARLGSYARQAATFAP